MIKKFVTIAIVSTFIMCGISFADDKPSTMLEPGSGIEGQLDKLTKESAYINGVLTKPYDEQSLKEEPVNPVTEDLIKRDIIPEAEARRLGGD